MNKKNLNLKALEASFLKLIPDNSFETVDSINDADGVMFLCPKCFVANKGPVGTHSVICWRPHVPQDVHPIPGRWGFLGNGIDDLELKAGSSSVSLTTGCKAHFFVRDGIIQMT